MNVWLYGEDIHGVICKMFFLWTIWLFMYDMLEMRVESV